jgi:calcineurin-like phosphoesterase family protein
MIWLTSDLHFDHTNIRKFTKRKDLWASTEEMNQGVIDNINSVVKKGDCLYILGDVIFGQGKTYPERMERYFSQMNGMKFLIKGNHDYHYKKDWFIKHFVWIRDYYELRVDDPTAANGKFNKLVLSHYPLYSWHNMQHGWWHAHGHCHSTIDKINEETTRLDVGLDTEHSNYYPISYEKIKEIMSKRTVKIVDHHDIERK